MVCGVKDLNTEITTLKGIFLDYLCIIVDMNESMKLDQICMMLSPISIPISTTHQHVLEEILD